MAQTIDMRQRHSGGRRRVDPYLRKRLLTRPQVYVMTRFSAFRTVFGLARGRYESFFNKDARIQINIRESLFSGLDPNSCVESLRRTGVRTDLQLPDELVQEISEFSSSTLCIYDMAQRHFLPSEVRGGVLPNGDTVPRANVIGAENLECLQRIAQDPLLLEIVTEYLGYRPRNPWVKLTWLFASEVPVVDRLQQASDYHYDTEHCHPINVIFYVSETSRSNGAHVVTLGSHKRKPLKFLLHPKVSKSDKEIHQFYGAEHELTIAGGPGLGFIEDGACYHKVIPPRDRDRLALHIRYM